MDKVYLTLKYHITMIQNLLYEIVRSGKWPTAPEDIEILIAKIYGGILRSFTMRDMAKLTQYKSFFRKEKEKHE